MSWEVKPICGDIHVIPKDDLEEHSTNFEWRGLMHGCFCKCGVRYEIEDQKVIVIHSSFDGREGVEWANALLSEK